MDKITHQVRAEHWAKIMNECINSGISKTAWCRANGISVKQFFYWQRSCAGKLRIPGIIVGSCRIASGNGADGASDSKDGLFY